MAEQLKDAKRNKIHVCNLPVVEFLRLKGALVSRLMTRGLHNLYYYIPEKSNITLPMERLCNKSRYLTYDLSFIAL